VDRCKGRVAANETPIGWMPLPEEIDTVGLDGYDPKDLVQALSVNEEDWKRECMLQDEFFIKIYSDLPKELIYQRELLIARL
jgi:phosphoenolpyruvate carboxykinase (GTP)